jgi:hypothetical protein
MTLGEFIEILEKYDPKIKLPTGLGNPHSWRGSYDEIAFEIVENTTVGEMLKAAQSIDGEVKTGYKGGEFRMNRDTPINIDNYGSYTGGRQIWGLLLNLMLGQNTYSGNT